MGWWTMSDKAAVVHIKTKRKGVGLQLKWLLHGGTYGKPGAKAVIGIIIRDSLSTFIVAKIAIYLVASTMEAKAHAFLRGCQCPTSHNPATEAVTWPHSSLIVSIGPPPHGPTIGTAPPPHDITVIRVATTHAVVSPPSPVASNHELQQGSMAKAVVQPYGPVAAITS
ncbi:hypothetical protein L3X38_032579 [Prunus dulcis]|uniref:Uncharacterized protein n=1 Tax=Prunus dulcis TaxID=3755 RepID=A0AAD4VGL9_PRUDU|nr:hypothetical protein L3X38_032579 [Prunus dulcis]